MSSETMTFKKPSPVASAAPAGTKTIKAPIRKGSRLSEAETNVAKIMLFGGPGSGKTHFIGQFVPLGLKVALLSTDVGGSGHLTIKTYLNSLGRKDLLDNVYLIELDGWKEVTAFLRDPYKFDPDLWAFDPDVLAWDGFSSFQQVDISEYVGGMQAAPKADGTTRDRGDFREEGLIFEQADWGAIRNASMRTVDKFLALKSPSGKPLHKVMTCLEAIAYKPKDSSKPNGPQEIVESYKPMLSGAGGQFALGGFDLIMRTAVKTERGEEGKVRVYTLITAGNQNLVAKNRGFELEPVEPADAKRIWEQVMKGLDAAT